MTQPAYDDQWITRPEDAYHPQGGHQIEENHYAAIVGLLIVMGFLMAGSGALTAWKLGGVQPWLFVGLGAVGMFSGYELTVRTRDWRGSLVGHIVSNFSLGMMLTPLVVLPIMGFFRNAALMILGGQLVLTITAWLFPEAVKAFGTFLVGAAAGALLGILLDGWWTPLIHADHVGIVSMTFTLFYLAYVDYYWTQALKLQRTLDNAVDTAAALEIGIVNRALEKLESRAELKHPGRS